MAAKSSDVTFEKVSASVKIEMFFHKDFEKEKQSMPVAAITKNRKQEIQKDIDRKKFFKVHKETCWFRDNWRYFES